MATKTKKATETASVDSIRHKDQRANIPTEELRDFVSPDEKAPKTMVYPRDPSLDPQLVWKGKDEQDAEDLEVPVVPIYIQEKIHPQALIDDLRSHAAGGREEAQASLFADFNGIKFEDYIDFYQHPHHWSNRMILGDSLLVMASLAEKEGLKGKVQMIYMDPPYGIKFGSNWQVSTRRRDVKDAKIQDLTRQPEQIRAFRDTWELGIHSYLSYLRDRLAAAHALLGDTGSIFIQIGDENVHVVRSLLDEVFGSQNFVSLITLRKTGGTTGEYLPGTADYLLWYAKDARVLKYRQLHSIREGGEDAPLYVYGEYPDGRRCKLGGDDITSPPAGVRLHRYTVLTSQRIREARTGFFPVEFEGETYYPTRGEWSTHPTGVRRLIEGNRVAHTGATIGFVRYLDDFRGVPLTNTWTDLGGAVDPIYVVQTSTKIVERCMLMSTDPGDLVLDPTCGSGTTAYVAEQWGRRWITTDTSRVALALARTRIMAAKYPYYVLADSADGIQKEAEVTGIPPRTVSSPENDVRKGFVFKRVPHITLKSIANNEEIDVIHGRHQEQLDGLRATLNKLTKHDWHEWEVPRDADGAWSAPARKAHEEWWQLRLSRQKQIDDSIARRGETEFLYDQPYEGTKRIRVSGPFTVESLSPHRVLSTEEERPESEALGAKEDNAGQFVNVILDNLRKAGVQNTVKDERLKFDRLDVFAGVNVHAAGEFTSPGGKCLRVAVCIGPQYGTVGPELVKEAAKEAVQGLGHDVLVVCGFAFDPHVSEEVKRYGRLQVLPAKMNPDLLMGDELLKKTGTGNLFMVFGEPDVELKPLKDGTIQVIVHGVDVYDPTTQQIRSHSTDDIACWFIDSDYNGESFFVRHAYFTGADQPYEKLKRALKADVDEAAWSALYSTTSRPFPKPKTGKIAVKVINHYGDEVLKVFAV
ncbi:MAG: DNA methyltransferase [Terracidiphilus sp.]|nr:DNA methyltransferase [Terracidiphilus sp.]